MFMRLRTSSEVGCSGQSDDHRISSRVGNLLGQKAISALQEGICSLLLVR